MRHRKFGVKLNRTASHRDAMFRNMVTSLIKHEKIQTTDAKAKELRRWADKIITLAKRGDLHARRQAMAIVREKEVVHKLFEEAAERFSNSAGGYTRITKLKTRPGDAAPVSIIELIAVENKTKPKKGKKKTKKAEVSDVKKEKETEKVDAKSVESGASEQEDTAVEKETAISQPVTSQEAVKEVAEETSPKTEETSEETKKEE